MTRTSFHSTRIARRHFGRQIRRSRHRTRKALGGNITVYEAFTEAGKSIRLLGAAIERFFNPTTLALIRGDYTLMPPPPRERGARRQLLSNGRKP